MKKKLLVALLVLTLVLTMALAGCGQKKEEEKKEDQTKTEEKMDDQTKTDEKMDDQTKTEEKMDDQTKTDEKMDETAMTTEYQYVDAQKAVDAAKAGNVHILDVREKENYEAGRLEGSLWSPIFPLDDTTLDAAMTTFAKENLSDGKEIYIVCNSGNKGAEKATAVLIAAGIDAKKIFTVEGGAKALAEIDGALTPVQQ